MQNFVAYFPVQSPESVYRQGFCTGHLLHRTLTLPKVPNSDYQCFLITKHVETISFNEAPCSVFFLWFGWPWLNVCLYVANADVSAAV